MSVPSGTVGAEVVFKGVKSSKGGSGVLNSEELESYLKKEDEIGS